MKYNYYNTCVGWDSRDVNNDGGLCDMIANCIDITRGTFLKHVDREEMKEIEKGLGYDSHHTQGLTMAADWHVSYHRSKLHDKTVYYFRWSGIEHVFTAA